MAGVVIINAREDGSPAQALAEKLGALGLQTSFSETGEQLRASAAAGDVVIALWSPHSYFRNELIEAAAIARDQHRLVHARMQNTPIPSVFERESSIDLTGWRGEENFQPWRHLLNAISGVLYAPPPEDDDDSQFMMQTYQEGDYAERAREYVATGSAYEQDGPAEAPLSSFQTTQRSAPQQAAPSQRPVQSNPFQPAPQSNPFAPPQSQPQPPPQAAPQPPLRTPPAPGQATARAAQQPPPYPAPQAPGVASRVTPAPIPQSAPATPMGPIPMTPASMGPASAAPAAPMGAARPQAPGPLQAAASPRFTPSFPPLPDALPSTGQPPNVLPNVMDVQKPPPGVPEFPPFPPPAQKGAPNGKPTTARHPVTPLSSYSQGSNYQRPSGFAGQPTRSGPSIVRLLIMGLVTFGVVAGAGIGGYMYLQRNETTDAAAAWNAVDKTDAFALRQFLDSGNAGPYREPAQATLDTLALDRLRSARDADTIEALQAFLVEFPDSRFAPQVNGRIAELRQLSGGGARTGATPRSAGSDSIAGLPEPQALPPAPPAIRAEAERSLRASDEPYSPSQSGQPNPYASPYVQGPPPSQAGGPLQLTPPGARDTPASIEEELRRQLAAPPAQQGPGQ